jgi:two-component system cell cycle sensor histidine kinase/response regulator CckA
VSFAGKERPKVSRVLIVDDQPENQYLLRALVQGYGYEATLADDGATALESARRTPPDIVISDIFMPVMDGFTLCREWMKDERLRGIPFVFYSATYTSPQDEELAKRLGAARFLVKPMEPVDFIDTLERVLHEREAGLLVAPTNPGDEETVTHRLYNDALVRKLEKKSLDLEKVRGAQEQEIAVRRRVEKALRESEGKYQDLSSEFHDILDAIPDTITRLSPDLEVIWANRSKAFSHNREPSDLVGCRCYTLMHEMDRPHEMCPVLETFRTGKAGVEIVTTPDRRIWELRTTPVKEGDRVVNVIEVGRDITEQQRTEEHLRQARKMEAVGRLAGGVAHDFNNMLNVILGYSEMALARLDPGSSLFRDLGEIQKAGLRSAELTQQLLAFSRKQITAPKVVRMNEAIEDQMNMLRRLIREEIRIDFLPSNGLWEIRIDPSQLSQILANLAVNARDAILGVGKITIETSNAVLDEAFCRNHEYALPGEYVMLAFSDTGTGMDPGTLERIFEPFFTTKEVGQGTGLGLATVYGIVKQNVGIISAYSEPGIGTTFRICLPRERGCTVDAVEPTRTPTPMGTETVLLVEDEEQILTLATRILEGNGYRVLPAHSPEDAYRLAERYDGKIDLLLTDLIMPGMNGKDLQKRIEEVRPGTRTLFMSGYTADAIAHHGVLEEGVALVQKPFTIRALAEKVRAVLDE